MAKLFPFFRGLPVMTTIFLLIMYLLLSIEFAGLTFPASDCIIIDKNKLIVKYAHQSEILTWRRV